MSRTFRSAFLGICLVALCSTLSFAQIQRSIGKGKMVLTTAQGATVYEHDMLSTIADFPNNTYKFYFKVPVFTSHNTTADANLMKVLDANSYGLISYDGKLTASLKRPAPGQTGTARMSGTLKFQGKQLKTDLTASTRLDKQGRLVMETVVMLDPNGNEAAKAAAASLGVTQPVSLTVIATY